MSAGADQDWEALCSQVTRWQKLARDQEEQTPAGDGSQRLPDRRCADGCNGCEDCTDPWNDYLDEQHEVLRRALEPAERQA